MANQPSSVTSPLFAVSAVIERAGASEAHNGTASLEPGSSRPLAPDAERPEAVMAVRNLALGFGKATVLDGISLEIPRRHILALVGATGSGKTTFLRSLNRMNDRVAGSWHRGEVLLDGVDIYGASVDPLAVRRRVGMVFQRPNPFPMSIHENVVAGIRAHRLAPRSQLKAICEERLTEVGLWDAVKRRTGDSPFRLSGGQQQLLCLARALAVEPEVLLLDEPTSSLDPQSTKAVEELLAKLVTKVTIVVVTHNLAQARRLSDYAAFFQQGRLVETGRTNQMFDVPEMPATSHYLRGHHE